MNSLIIVKGYNASFVYNERIVRRNVLRLLKELVGQLDVVREHALKSNVEQR